MHIGYGKAQSAVGWCCAAGLHGNGAVELLLLLPPPLLLGFIFLPNLGLAL
jgi:hypothetical protein